MYCPHCGKQVEEGKKFCTQCGNVLSNAASQPGVTPGAASPSKTKIRLIIISASVFMLLMISGVVFVVTQTGLLSSLFPSRPIASASSTPRPTDAPTTAPTPTSAPAPAATQPAQLERLANTITEAQAAERTAALFSEAEAALTAGDVQRAYELINQLQTDARYVSGVRGTDDAFTPEVNAVYSALEDDLTQLKKDNSLQFLSWFEQTAADEALAGFLSEEHVTDGNRDRLYRDLADAYMATGRDGDVERILRDMMNPLTEESIAYTVAFKNSLNAAYPDRQKAYEIINTGEYDTVMPFDNGLARVGMDRGSGIKWGLIDDTGAVIVTPAYDAIGYFQEGLCPVMSGGRYGFIDESGTLVIPVMYEDIYNPATDTFYVFAVRDPENTKRGFYNGFASVMYNGQWGYINKDNEPLGEGFVYNYAPNFNEGLAVPRKLWNGLNYSGLLQTNGRYIFEPFDTNAQGYRLRTIRSIYEGLAGGNWLNANNTTSRGIVNSGGQVVYRFPDGLYDLVQDFREGLAIVEKSDKLGFIDRQGNLVVPIQFDTATVFINGLSKVSVGGKYGLINRDGRYVLPADYDEITDFYNEFGTIRSGNGYGVINNRGEIVCDTVYEMVGRCSNGVIPVKSGGLWGLVDTGGAQIIPPQYEMIQEYQDGLSPACFNGKWGYIDIYGYFTIEPVFLSASPFSDGAAFVQTGDGSYQFIRLKQASMNLSGYVFDDNDEALTGAAMTAYASGNETGKPIASALTNRDGEYMLVLPEGDYRIVASKDGYYDTQIFETIEGADNDATPLNLIKRPIDNVRAANVSINILNALDGGGLEGLTVYFRDGYNNTRGDYITDGKGLPVTAVTNADGALAVSLPLGNYTAEVVSDNFAHAFINFCASAEEYMRNKILNLPVTPKLAEGEIRITLQWGASPSDLDSHLLGYDDSGTSFHVYYPLKGQTVNNVMLDRDDTNGNGFETVTISRASSQPYTYHVFDFSNGNDYYSDAMSRSNASVNVYQGDIRIATFDVPVGRVGTVWDVFTYSDGIITPINEVSNHYDSAQYIY
jgi:hypothetical protein